MNIKKMIINLFAINLGIFSSLSFSADYSAYVPFEKYNINTPNLPETPFSGIVGWDNSIIQHSVYNVSDNNISLTFNSNKNITFTSFHLEDITSSGASFSTPNILSQSCAQTNSIYVCSLNLHAQEVNGSCNSLEECLEAGISFEIKYNGQYSN